MFSRVFPLDALPQFYQSNTVYLVIFRSKREDILLVTPRNLDDSYLQDLKTWFHNYARMFRNQDDKWKNLILLKHAHSIRVCKEILLVGRQLGLYIEELRLAEAIALLHDIGRFEQYSHYREKEDTDTLNHADLGVKIIQENHLISRLPQSVQEVILQSIQFHNCAVLPKQNSNKVDFFARLLRDADKLDIWRIFINRYRHKIEKQQPLKFAVPNELQINPALYHSLSCKKVASLTQVQSLNDLKLIQMAWVYDINFEPTYTLIANRRYLEIIYESMTLSEEVESIFAATTFYLSQKIHRS